MLEMTNGKVHGKEGAAEALGVNPSTLRNRHWYEKSAMADLLGVGFELVKRHKLYDCLDRIHKEWSMRRGLRDLAPQLTPRSVLKTFPAVQMIDVHLPTTDGRKVILSRYPQPEPELQILLRQLRLSLPNQPPPRVTAKGELTR